MLLISRLWKWAHSHFVNNPQIQITPEEFGWVKQQRTQVKAHQEWLTALESHVPELCNDLECELCIEIEHNRIIEAGEIACD